MTLYRYLHEETAGVVAFGINFALATQRALKRCVIAMHCTIKPSIIELLLSCDNSSIKSGKLRPA